MIKYSTMFVALGSLLGRTTSDPAIPENVTGSVFSTTIGQRRSRHAELSGEGAVTPLDLPQPSLLCGALLWLFAYPRAEQPAAPGEARPRAGAAMRST